MQIESLKVFCDLAETQSFTKAAHINSVTQSAVSQTISAMERQFKSLLAERSKKNFRLTREGQIVYDYSKELLQAFATLQSRMLEVKNVASDNLRLATIHSLGLHRLPPCLNQFAKDYPSVNIKVEYRRSHQVYAEVLGDEVDFGLVAYPVRNPKLELVPLGDDKLVVICHPRNPLARSKVVKFKALNGQNFVNFDAEQPSGRAVHRLLRAHRVTVQPIAEFDDIEALKRAVEIDSGVAIVPQATVLQEAASQSLAALALEGNHARPLAAIYRKNKAVSRTMSQFIDLLKKSL